MKEWLDVRSRLRSVCAWQSTAVRSDGMLLLQWLSALLVLLLPPLVLRCRLANEITNLSDAATLYPLFGLGANLAQALAGMVLKVCLTWCNRLGCCCSPVVKKADWAN